MMADATPRPNLKKRHTDAVQHGSIHKPFRSPLRNNHNAINQTPTRPTFHSARSEPQKPFLLSNTSSSSSVKPRSQDVEYLPSIAAHSKPHLQPAPSHSSPTKESNTCTTQTHQPHPSILLTRLRNEIDTLQQSLQLISTPCSEGLSTTPDTSHLPARDIELTHLIDKWRTVARNAAEDLYDTAKEKVDSMGGMPALRAQEEEKADRRRRCDKEAEEEERRRMEEKLDDEGDVSGEGQEMGESETSMRKEEVRDARRAVRRVGEQARDDDDGEEGLHEREKEAERSVWDARGDDEGFTMEMMLQSMNVDLNVLGWDRKEQQWFD